MKNILFITLFILTAFQFVYFQGRSQTTIISNAAPGSAASGAVLDIQSTNKGVSIPNIALTKLSLATPVTSPVTGLLVYNTAIAGTAPDNVTPGFYYWTGSAWSKLLVGGNASGNTTIEADGTVIFNGTATVWNDLVVSIASAKATGSNAPQWVSFINGIYLYSFRESSSDEMFFNVQMPHDWKEGSTIYPHIHFAPGNNTSTGNVVWQMEYTWAEYNSSTPESFPPTTTTTVQAPAFAISAGQQYKHLIAPFSSITPSTTQDNISSMLLIRLFRNGSYGTDSYTADVYAISFDIHYEIDAIGSRTELAK